MGFSCGVCRKVRKWMWKGVLWITLSLSAIQLYLWMTTEYGNPPSLNYFLDDSSSGGSRNGSVEYVINTPRCQILKISPWDKAILPFTKVKIKRPECRSRNRNWSYVQGTKLILNVTAIQKSGYSFGSLRCCFRGILRVEQTPQSFTFDSDNQVRYSEECTKVVEEVTELKDEFVRVFCTSNSWPYLGSVVYREFHAVVLPKAYHKVKYWRRLRERSDKVVTPPSVVMIGVDSLSRMNFHRSFAQTRDYLMEIGAVEFEGYTKVGENTLPNTVAFLSGISFEELGKEGCLRSRNVPQDECPYIWKRFDKANYLTATIEDAPGLVGFNYDKQGFVNRPTDFYFRPFMLAVHKSLPRMDYYHTDCIGRYTTEETLLNYIQGIMNYSASAGVPVFIHSWMTSLAHLDINGPQFADQTVVQFLKTSDLSNTILIFISDHGQRYGSIRETLAGWYEDKLPTLLIYLPPEVTKLHPQWKTSLQTNAKRLTSPFDLYLTLSQVLDSSPSVEDNTGSDKTSFGQSLFTPVSPLRVCRDAGIRSNYCACLPPRKVEADDPQVVAAAGAAIAYLNNAVPSQCVQFELGQITAAAALVMEINRSSNNAAYQDGQSDGATTVSYIVTFYTIPGDFMFEAVVDLDSKSMGFSVTTDLLRMNRIRRDVSCVHGSLLERYCYCKG